MVKILAGYSMISVKNCPSKVLVSSCSLLLGMEVCHAWLHLCLLDLITVLARLETSFFPIFVEYSHQHIGEEKEWTMFLVKVLGKGLPLGRSPLEPPERLDPAGG